MRFLYHSLGIKKTYLLVFQLEFFLFIKHQNNMTQYNTATLNR